MSYKIFVSHNSKDIKHVAKLSQELGKAGFRIYTYEEDRQPGIYVADKVKKGIKESDALLALLTKTGADSAYVQEEIGAAEMAGKLVIPLVERGVKQAELGMLVGKETIAFDPRAPDKALEALVPFVMNQAEIKNRKEVMNGVIAAAVAFLLLYALHVAAKET